MIGAVCDCKQIAPTTAGSIRAYDILADQAAKDQDQHYTSSSYDPAAAMLLPLAERLQPESVTELFWRAVSFRIPWTEDDELEVAYPRGSVADAALAFTLARYDRTVPRLLLEDTFSVLIKHFDTGGNELVNATAMLDPVEAMRVIELCPNERRRDGIRQALARLLLRDEDSLWRRPGQFVPDEEN